MKNMILTKMLPVLGVLFVASCGGTAASSSSDSATLTTGLVLVAAADFETSASSSVSHFATTSQCGGETPPTTMDSPDFSEGADCDGDGGLVSFATPTQYKVAVKRASLVREDGTLFDVIDDSIALSDSEVIEFSTTDVSQNVVEFDPADLEAGTYTGIRVELYYYQMTFPVAETNRNVRIYMSDDDFEDQDNGGHHQGDITFIDDADIELGWVSPDWLIDSLLSSSAEQEGAGGVDSETGHDRGFFGNADFWNSSDFSQGVDQDIYFGVIDFSTDLTISDAAELDSLITIEISFLVGDAFYYEDFTPQGTGFYPDTGGEATSEDAEWAPLAPTIRVSVTEE